MINEMIDSYDQEQQMIESFKKLPLEQLVTLIEYLQEELLSRPNVKFVDEDEDKDDHNEDW